MYSFINPLILLSSDTLNILRKKKKIIVDDIEIENIGIIVYRNYLAAKKNTIKYKKYNGVKLLELNMKISTDRYKDMARV